MTEIEKIEKTGDPEAILPYLKQLWFPLLVYSIIEIGFKTITYYFSHSGFAMSFAETTAYLLRVIFEVSILSQLALLLKKPSYHQSDLAFPL